MNRKIKGDIFKSQEAFYLFVLLLALLFNLKLETKKIFYFSKDIMTSKQKIDLIDLVKKSKINYLNQIKSNFYFL